MLWKQSPVEAFFIVPGLLPEESALAAVFTEVPYPPLDYAGLYWERELQA